MAVTCSLNGAATTFAASTATASLASCAIAAGQAKARAQAKNHRRARPPQILNAMSPGPRKIRRIIYHQFGSKETQSAAIIAERYETLLLASCSVPGSFGTPISPFQSCSIVGPLRCRLGDPKEDRPDVTLG
jgi:hypothetical protein